MNLKANWRRRFVIATLLLVLLATVANIGAFIPQSSGSPLLDNVTAWLNKTFTHPVLADSVDLYWYPVGGTGTGNWNGGGHWATAADGTGLGHADPTATNNVYFTSTSFTGAGQIVTVNSTATCLSMDWTGATNTPTLAGSSALNIYGNITLLSGMGFTYSGLLTAANASGNQTLTTNTVVLTCTLKFIAGSTLVLGDDISSRSSTPFSSQGLFNANGKTVTITVDSLFPSWGASLTFYNLIINGYNNKTNYLALQSNQTVTNALTISSYSTNSRTIVRSNTFNTPRTINCTGATTNFTDADFQDIVISGSPTVGTNVRVGDCGGNTGQTFTAAVPKYWVGDTGSWSDATNHWSLADDGAPGVNNYPLPQDTALFTVNSVKAASKTITMDEPRYSGIDFSSVANTPTVSLSNDLNFFGSLDLTGVGTFTSSGKYVTFYGRSAYTLTTNLKTFHGISINCVTGNSVTLQDTLTVTTGFYIYKGTFDFGNQDAFLPNLSISSGATLTLGSGTITLTYGVAAIWTFNSGATLTANTATIVISSAGVIPLTFAGGDKTTYNNLTIQGAGAYALTIDGSNTFNVLTVDRSAAAKTLKITNSTTQTVSNFVCATSGTTVLTITNTSSTTPGTLTKTGGGTISLDYVNVSYNTATPSYTWSYGANGVPGSGVTGWSNGTPTDTLYWVADSGNWSDSTHHWAPASGGTPNAIFIPLADVSVAFDASSFSGGGLTVTQDSATAKCLNMDWTNATNTPTWAGSSALSIYGSLTFIAGMTQAYTGTITLAATTSGKTVTCGKTLACPITVNGVGGAWTLQDTMNLAAQTFTLTAGSFTTNSQAMTTTGIITISGSTTRTFNIAGSTITCGTWTATTTTGLTFSSTGSTINMTGSTVFSGGNITTYETVELQGATPTITGTNAFVNLRFINAGAAQTVSITNSTVQTVSGTFTATGQSTSNRCIFRNSSGTTYATISAGTVAVTKATIFYITASGAGNWDLSASANDVLQGNVVNSCTGIIFGLYWYKDTGNWTSPAQWSSVSGATANAVVVPDATTKVFFDANSFSAGSKTVTVNGTANCLSMNWTGATNTPTFAGSSSLAIYGSLTFISGMIQTFSGGITFAATTSGNTITCGLTLTTVLTFAGTGEWTLQDTMNLTASNFNLNSGTFITNSQAITTTGQVIISNTPTRTFNMSGSTITCSSWTATTTTGLTFITDASSKIILTGATCVFNGGSLTNYKEVDLNGSGTTTIIGSNTFTALVLPSGTTQTIKFTDGTTQHMTTATLSGSSGHVHTLTGTSTGGWNIVADGASAAVAPSITLSAATNVKDTTATLNGNLTATGAGGFFEDYINLSYSNASPANIWFYGSNSTYGVGNSGWSLWTNPTVTTYWGTTDGGQVPGDWDDNSIPTSPAQPQGVAPFYKDTTSLIANTLYYFSAAATNAVGTTWVTSSLSFTTTNPSGSATSAGFVVMGRMYPSETYSTGLSVFTVTNTGNCAIDVLISGTDMTGGNTWTLSDTATPGPDTFGIIAGISGGSYNVIVKKTAPYNILISNLAIGASQQYGFQFLTPTSNSDGVVKTGTVTLSFVTH